MTASLYDVGLCPAFQPSFFRFLIFGLKWKAYKIILAYDATSGTLYWAALVVNASYQRKLYLIINKRCIIQINYILYNLAIKS